MCGTAEICTTTLAMSRQTNTQKSSSLSLGMSVDFDTFPVNQNVLCSLLCRWRHSGRHSGGLCRHEPGSVRLARDVLWYRGGERSWCWLRVDSSWISPFSSNGLHAVLWHVRLLWLRQSCWAFSTTQAVLSQFFTVFGWIPRVSLFADTSCAPPLAWSLMAGLLGLRVPTAPVIQCVLASVASLEVSLRCSALSRSGSSRILLDVTQALVRRWCWLRVEVCGSLASCTPWPCAQAHGRLGHVHRDMAPIIRCTVSSCDRHMG